MPNPLCHFELMASDPNRAKAFYGAIFDWKFDDSSMPGYTLIHTGAEPGGGFRQRDCGGAAIRPRRRNLTRAKKEAVDLAMHTSTFLSRGL